MSIPDQEITSALARISTPLATLLVLGSLATACSAGDNSPGVGSDRFSGVTDILRKSIDEKGIAGAVAIIVDRGETVYKRAIGKRDVARGEAMTTDTLFRIASMTKPITSVAIMMLIEEGKIALDDPLSKFIPEFADVRFASPASPPDAPRSDSERTPSSARPITIHDLLTHTSGLTYGFLSPDSHLPEFGRLGVCEGLVEAEHDLAENCRRLARAPLIATPGTEWNYSLSTDVLGRVIEVASDMTLQEFFRTRILLPLKMHDTHFVVPEKKLHRLATLYEPDEEGRIRVVPTGSRNVENVNYSASYQHPGATSYFSGGAGLVSSADDYVRFLRMLLNRGELEGMRLLRSETVDLMTRNQIGDLTILFTIHGDKFGYGFGVHSKKSERMGASIGTYSWGGIFHTYFWVDPKREVIGVVMTQLYPFSHLTLWGDFQQAAYDALDQTMSRPADRSPRAGDVYREYAVHNGGNIDWRVTDPDAAEPRAWQFLPNPLLTINIDDLEHAVRAEAILDRWGGHLRTTRKAIRLNRHPWLIVPELSSPPAERAEYYYSQDNPVISIPLEHLREGVNTFEGTCSTLNNYGWGQWGLYSLILRVYYDPALKDHASARIVAPAAGSEFGEDPQIRLRGSSDVMQADVRAWYDGEDEDGDGVFQDWHGAFHQPERGEPAALSHHVGTDTTEPFGLRWNTTWVPDQSPGTIKLIARVRNGDGIWTVTEPVEDLTLVRDTEHVALYRAEDVPEQFGVRVGRERACRFQIPDENVIQNALEVKLSLRTWHGWDGHHSPFRFNGHEFANQGKNHHYDLDRLGLPKTILRQGSNSFQVHSDTEHHMLEVLWPGPALLIRYRDGE